MWEIAKMNERDREEIAAALRAALAALDEGDTLGAESQAVVALDQQAVGRLSRMDALQGQAMAQAQQGRRDIARKRIAAALARVETGDFGYCADCGEEIAPARLELDPAAPLCISCARG